MLAEEPHYEPNELAKLWKLSAKTIIRWFKEEPGVLHTGSTTSRKVGREYKRRYDRLKIPESVARRVHARRSQSPN